MYVVKSYTSILSLVVIRLSQNSIFKTKSQSFVVISPIIRQVKNVPLTEPLYQGPLPQVL